MNEIGPESSRRNGALPREFWTLAGWLAWSMGCLALADHRASASAGPGGTHATAIGLAVGVVIFLPLLTRCSAWIGTLILFVLLADVGRPWSWSTLQIAAQLALVAWAISTIWAKLVVWPRTQTLFLVALVVWTLGLPALAYLAHDFGDGSGLIFPASLPHLMVTTFSHD